MFWLPMVRQNSHPATRTTSVISTTATTANIFIGTTTIATTSTFSIITTAITLSASTSTKTTIIQALLDCAGVSLPVAQFCSSMLVLDENCDEGRAS